MPDHPTTEPHTLRFPAPDERKPYTPPAILISLPLEASAGSTPITKVTPGGSSDGWDDEW